MLSRHSLICIPILFLLLIAPGLSMSQEVWESYETDCCSIQYYDENQLNDFSLRVGGIRYTSNGLDGDIETTGYRVDEIMEKVSNTLDMYPEEVIITILLYPDHDSLGEIFREITQEEYVPLAFYSHSTESIHVDASSFTEGILAHEMAHAIINMYYDEPLPAKTQEILAQYVDKHLWD